MDFIPPNGSWISAPIVPAFTYTIPVSASRMKRKALLMLRVYTDDERPYLVLLSTLTASSTLLTSMTEVTGPKISS